MSGLAILCPGQGAQHPEMFALLAEHKAAADVLKVGAGILDGDPAAVTRRIPAEGLFANAFAQPLICMAEMAMWFALRDSLPTPRVFAGYSVGELAAYGCSGALDAKQTLDLAVKRAALMDEASGAGHGLIAVRGMAAGRVEALCAHFGVEVAIVNGPDHFVVGGTTKNLLPLAERAAGCGAQTVRQLPIDVASHTSAMAEAGSRYADALSAADFSDPPIPVLAGISGEVVRNRARAVKTLAQQLSHPLDWAACMESVIEMGCGVVLELGPGNALTRMFKETFPGVRARAAEEFRSLRGVVDWVNKHCDD